MNKTIEKQADVKNGVSRMIFAVISILLEVAVIWHSFAATATISPRGPFL